MSLHITDSGERIQTHHIFPPIPCRSHDWSATSYDYDADWLGEEDGWRGSHPVGYGPTEEEAIRDYLEQIEEIGT